MLKSIFLLSTLATLYPLFTATLPALGELYRLVPVVVGG